MFIIVAAKRLKNGLRLQQQPEDDASSPGQLEICKTKLLQGNSQSMLKSQSLLSGFRSRPAATGPRRTQRECFSRNANWKFEEKRKKSREDDEL